MNEYSVELYIYNGDEGNIKALSLNGEKTEHRKKDMEARALSEYYKRKIKITGQKI